MKARPRSREHAVVLPLIVSLAPVVGALALGGCAGSGGRGSANGGGSDAPTIDDISDLLEGITVAPPRRPDPTDEELAERATRLCAAIDSGDLAAVTAALPGTNLEVGVGAGEDETAERTPLIHAVLAESAEIVEALVHAGARLDHTDEGGHTPLMYAVLTGNADLVRALLRLGARLDLDDEEGNSAWSYTDEDSELETFVGQAKEQAEALLFELGLGDVAGALESVASGSCPNTNNGETCLLSLAIQRGQLADVDAALAAGARVDLWLDNGFNAETPLAIAASEAPLPVLARLVAAKPHALALSQALPNAAGSEHADRIARVELLLDAGADVNAELGFSSPALARAATLGDLETMRLLALRGADERQVDEAYVIAPSAPADRVWPTIQLLEAMGADPDREVLILNALGTATERCDEFIVRHLYSRATPETANVALQVAADRGNVACVRLLHGLLGPRADFAWRDAFHAPALIAAVREGHGDCVEVLVELGADVNQSGQDMVPDSPLLTAVRKDDATMVALLIRLGADPNRAYDGAFGSATTARAEAHERGNSAVLAALGSE